MSVMKTPRPVVLCILDGVGWGKRDDGDAFATANTPNLDALMQQHPWCLLQAHGTAVGMPSDGDMGNSEVGHNAIGAGRVFAQGAKLVQDAVNSGILFESDAWQRAIQGNTLHLMGLVSDGNVHSHIDHLRAMIARAQPAGGQRLRRPARTDGRDAAPRSALTWIEPLEQLLAAQDGDYAIGSGGGRMHITMDRYEADWEMVARGYNAHVYAEGRRFESAAQAIQTLYDENSEVDDQWLPAFIVGEYDGMKDRDAVVFFNFRGDRALEISRAFESGDAFDAFDRGARRPEVFYAGMMEYDGDLNIPKNYLVQPPDIRDTIGERIAAADMTFLSISETQKFGHVTFFINGNRSGALNGEQQEEIPSVNVPFDQLPQMSADAITERVVAAIEGGEFDHIRLNIANGDMVGHTGKFGPALQAMEVVDQCVGGIAAATQRVGGVLMVTADHGNVEEMFKLNKKTGEYTVNSDGSRVVSTSHSLNPVPFILVDGSQKWALREPKGADAVVGGLAQIGGTILELCGLEVPEHYLPSLVQPAER